MEWVTKVIRSWTGPIEIRKYQFYLRTFITKEVLLVIFIITFCFFLFSDHSF